MVREKVEIAIKPQVEHLLTELGESARDAYRALAQAEGIDLADDSSIMVAEFHGRNRRLRQALFLFDQWHDGEGAFRKGADPREGTPAEYLVLYNGNEGKEVLFEAATRAECEAYEIEHPNHIQGTRIEPGDLVWKRAAQVEVGDLIDLEADKYADPFHHRLVFQTHLAEVAEVSEVEKGLVVVIYIEGVNGFGMPPDHLLRVRSGENKDKDYEQVARAAGYSVFEGDNHPGVFFWASAPGVVSQSEYASLEDAWRGCVEENDLNAEE